MSDAATETTQTSTETTHVVDPTTLDAADVEDSGQGGGDREALLDALKNASSEETAEGETTDATGETAEAAATDKAAAETKEAPAAPAEPKIAAVIRAREEARKKVQEAQGEAERMRADAAREAEQMRAQARADAEKWKSDEAARFRAKFGEAPLEALNEYGVPREKLVDDVARDGTPEFRAIKAERAAREELAKELAELKAWKAEQSKAAEEGQRQAQAQARARVEHEFLTQHASAEKTPHLAKLPRAVVLTMAHQQADEWRKDGVPFDNGDIAEYLEHQIRTSFGSTSSREAAGTSGNSAPKAKANGTRTLNAQGGSERRASPKPFEDLDVEDPAAAKASLLEAYRDGRP